MNKMSIEYKENYTEKKYNHYIVTGSHGIILHNNDDTKTKKNYYTIPRNVILVLYSSFCGRSCTNSNSIKQYICHSSNRSLQNLTSVNMTAQDILYTGDKIPNLYGLYTRDRNEQVSVSRCDNGEILELWNYDPGVEVKLYTIVGLHTIINDIKTSQYYHKKSNDIIILHWTLCLEVIDKNQFLNNGNVELIQPCDEEILGIERGNSKRNVNKNTAKVFTKKNTFNVISTNYIDKFIKIYITFPSCYQKDYIDIMISFHNNRKSYIQLLKENNYSPNIDRILRLYKDTFTDRQKQIILNNISEENIEKEIIIVINANDIISKIYKLKQRKYLDGIKLQDIDFMNYLIVITLLYIKNKIDYPITIKTQTNRSIEESMGKNLSKSLGESVVESQEYSETDITAFNKVNIGKGITKEYKNRKQTKKLQKDKKRETKNKDRKKFQKNKKKHTKINISKTVKLKKY